MLACWLIVDALDFKRGDSFCQATTTVPVATVATVAESTESKSLTFSPGGGGVKIIPPLSFLLLLMYLKSC